MTGGVGIASLLQANFGELVLGCIEAKFRKQILFGISYLFEKKIEKRAEMYTMHSFAPAHFYLIPDQGGP